MKPSRQRTADDHGSESGVALVLGILFTVIISGLVVSGTLVMRAHRATTETSFHLHGQAAQFARAGLIEALGWFRRQTAQPVTAFAPQLDMAADPPIIDTQDPEIGIVREFEISGSTYGRYEVWKDWPGDPDADRRRWRQKVRAVDISAQIGATGYGNAWRVRSVGYVFENKDPNKAFDQLPNRVISTEILETEIRRMTLAPPGEAAMCSRYGAQTTIDKKVSIHGVTGAGIYYKSGTNVDPIVRNGAKVNGSPGLSPSDNYDDRIEAVFGVSSQDLRTLADDRITKLADFPTPLPMNSLYYVEVPTLEITDARKLRGSAVVYVKGDVDIQYNNKSFFTGLLFVDGNLTIREPFEFNGTIICNGTVLVFGDSDWINISYDDAALNNLRTEIGQYRLSSAIRSKLSREAR